ncbi:hypothetical protein [Hydrogenimonas sp. SS33]|uniref:hypothetical protein n=1 Tax=Hydrogenimonas leucolamina TaxID=2954236 RepID=UPI00336C2C97
MKKVDSVLTHLLAHPVYAKLQEQACFRLIRKALPETLRRGVLFMYVKNRILFFAVKHPAFKMEFDYKLATIKNLLTTLPPLQEACGAHGIRDIRVFVSRFAPKPAPSPETHPRYKERATGAFDLRLKDEALQESFESIKKSIAENRRG